MENPPIKKINKGELERVTMEIGQLSRAYHKKSYIDKTKKKGIPISMIAKACGRNQNRVRFLVDILLADCIVKKICISKPDCGDGYKRYIYEVVK